MLRNKNVTSRSCVVSKMNRIKIDTKRVERIMHDTSLAGLSIGVQNTKRVSDTKWKSFEFYSESSSECNQCELQAVLRPV